MSQLKDALQKMFSGDRRACRQVAEYCHDTARAYLNYKLNNNDEQVLEGYLRRDDLAWDCIAGLFERSDNGKYVVFREFLSDYNIDELTESETKIVLRRLIFSKVNDGIFRNFGVYDPSLSKIIRNIKLAVKDNDDLEITNDNGQKILRCSDAGDLGLPNMPPEFLEIRLFHRVESNMHIPDVIDAVSQLLQYQSIYRPAVAITQLAISVRRVFARLNDIEEGELGPEEAPLLNSEIEEQIEASIKKQKIDLADTYLNSGKMSEEEFETYFKAVRSIIRDEFVAENPEADTYFEHLKRFIPDLAKKTYRQEHRQYLEYMTQKTRDYLVDRFRKVMKYSAEG